MKGIYRVAPIYFLLAFLVFTGFGCTRSDSGDDLSGDVLGDESSVPSASKPAETVDTEVASGVSVDVSVPDRVKQLHETTEDGRPVWRSGHYGVMLPSGWEDADEFANFSLSQLQTCMSVVEDFVGWLGPYKGDEYWQVYDLSNSSVSFCCGQAPRNEIINKQTESELKYLVHSGDAYWRKAKDTTICLGGHEEFHRLVYGCSLPSFANEGLATLIEQDLRDLDGAIAGRTLYECRTNGFYGVNIEGKVTETPYVPVDRPSLAEHRIDFYRTGACFWNLVEEITAMTRLER